MSDKIYSAIPRTAEEITGTVGCKAFSWYFEGNIEYVHYSRGMNSIALRNERIKLRPIEGDRYNFVDIEEKWRWRKEWLKDIREESNK